MPSESSQLNSQQKSEKNSQEFLGTPRHCPLPDLLLKPVTNLNNSSMTLLEKTKKKTVQHSSCTFRQLFGQSVWYKCLGRSRFPALLRLRGLLWFPAHLRWWRLRRPWDERSFSMFSPEEIFLKALSPILKESCNGLWAKSDSHSCKSSRSLSSPGASFCIILLLQTGSIETLQTKQLRANSMTVAEAEDAFKALPQPVLLFTCSVNLVASTSTNLPTTAKFSNSWFVWECKDVPSTSTQNKAHASTSADGSAEVFTRLGAVTAVACDPSTACTTYSYTLLVLPKCRGWAGRAGLIVGRLAFAELITAILAMPKINQPVCVSDSLPGPFERCRFKGVATSCHFVCRTNFALLFHSPCLRGGRMRAISSQTRYIKSILKNVLKMFWSMFLISKTWRKTHLCALRPTGSVLSFPHHFSSARLAALLPGAPKREKAYPKAKEKRETKTSMNFISLWNQTVGTVSSWNRHSWYPTCPNLMILLISLILPVGLSKLLISLCWRRLSEVKTHGRSCRAANRIQRVQGDVGFSATNLHLLHCFILSGNILWVLCAQHPTQISANMPS